jgi:c-di-GMP-binding flagellar brake protein YcgR
MGVNKIEKRKTVRHNVEFVVSIIKDGKLVSPNNNFKDLSTLGCLILIANHFKFKRGDKVILQIEDEILLKEFNLILDPIEAEVKHFDNNNETFVGFVFLNISDRNQKILQSIIDNKFILKKFPKLWQISR